MNSTIMGVIDLKKLNNESHLMNEEKDYLTQVKIDSFLENIQLESKFIRSGSRPPTPPNIGTSGLINQVGPQCQCGMLAQSVINSKQNAFLQQEMKKYDEEQKKAKKQCEELIRAEAYSRMDTYAGKLCVQDRRGTLHCVLDRDITKVLHVLPHALFRMPPCYALEFAGMPGGMLLIKEAEFESNRRLIEVIVKYTKLNISLVTSEKRTAELIRQVILRRAQELEIDFYSGWDWQDGKWKFELTDGSTHRKRNLDLRECEHYREKKTVSTTAQLIAAERITEMMKSICDPNVRAVATLIWHVSALSTVISMEGYRSSLGVCFYSTDARALRLIESIFSWFGDKPILMDSMPSSFLDHVIERMDQPAVFSAVSSFTGKNGAALQTILRTGEIPLKEEEMGCSLKFNAFPVLVTSSVNSLQMSGSFVVVDISNDRMASDAATVIQSESRYMEDYLLGFTGYVSEHIDKLRQYLNEGLEEAGMIVEGLSRGAVDLLAEFIGVGRIVSDYCRWLSPKGLYPFDNMDLEVSDVFLDALIDASGAAESHADLADIFIQTTNEMFARELFEVRSTRHEGNINAPCKEGRHGIVYVDDTYISFSSQAFRLLCESCNVSVPVMVRALRDRNMFSGVPANSETATSRIMVYSVYGNSKRIYVYKFKQSLFE